MNGKNNLCMSEMKKIYITGLWILCLTSGVSAQTYDIIERRNSWNAGANVTGIMMDSISASYAELYGKNNQLLRSKRSMECRSGSKVHHSSERLFTDGFVLIRSYFRQGYERFDVYPPRILSRRPPGVHTRT